LLRFHAKSHETEVFSATISSIHVRGVPMTTVANWYHCSVKPVSRMKARTAIAAAAYQSGTRLRNEQTQEVSDFTRRRGVETWFVVAPEWAYNLERLWNEAQFKDNRINSRMAREVELALPSSLDATHREALVRITGCSVKERCSLIRIQVEAVSFCVKKCVFGHNVTLPKSNVTLNERGRGGKSHLIESKDGKM
jgi:hypothetical protein